MSLFSGLVVEVPIRYWQWCARATFKVMWTIWLQLRTDLLAVKIMQKL